MSPDPGGVFSVLYNLCRFGLGGIQGPGTQYVSWMHDQDYIRAVEFLIDHPEISGPVNFTAPNPLPNRTESELVLKSRRAIPTVLLQHGFTFDFPNWPEAVQDLVTRFRSKTKS
jgi:NAD dependent epimerase/dehydratase family enzyme